MQTIKFIDLYAGIGGLRLPFQNLNYQCVFTSEKDKFAQKTYQTYWGEGEICGAIENIAAEKIPKFNLLLAGFPCQPFSIIGKRQAFADERGNAFFEIERIFNHHHSEFIFLENVRNLISIDKGRVFKYILKSLEKAGYFVKWQELKAKDFNLPQFRQRVYILAFKNEAVFNNFNFPEPIKNRVCLGDILEKNPAEKYTLSDKGWAGIKKRNANGKKNFARIIYTEKSKHTKAIVASYFSSKDFLLDQKNKNPRILTPLEAARLQGIPDELIIKAQKAGMSDHQLYKQIGNSVAIPVVSAIANKLKEAIKAAAEEENRARAEYRKKLMEEEKTKILA